MEIEQGQNEVFLCEKEYVREILKILNMVECKCVTTLMIQKEKLQKVDGEEPTNENVYRSLVECHI